MATSGSVSTSKYDGRYCELTWSSTKSGNVSTVTWEANLKGGNSSYYITSQCFFEITCSKGTSSKSKITVLSYDTSRKGYKGSIGSGSFTITHNSTGEGAFSIKLSIATFNHDVNCTGSNSWTLPTTSYTIKYDKGNATNWSNAPSNQTKQYGVNLTLSSTIPTTTHTGTGTRTITFDNKTNGGSTANSSKESVKTLTYKFNKYNTKLDRSGTSYEAGGTYSANAGATLYAGWSVANSDEAYPTITAPTPTKNSTTSTRTVTFNATTNGGKCDTSSLNSTATTTYSCSGYYTAATDGTKRCNAGAAFSPSKTETLYAQYSGTQGSFSEITLPKATKDSTSKTYTLILDVNGGDPLDQSSYSIVNTIENRFQGWHTTASGSGATNYGGTGYKMTPPKTMTLYARFVPTPVNEKVVLPTPTKAGFSFVGWDTSATAAFPAYAGGEEIGISEDTTLHAIWKVDNPYGWRHVQPYIFLDSTWQPGAVYVY